MDKKKLDQRVTVYLSEKTVESLEMARLKLRKLIPPENRVKLTKSKIIEEALKIELAGLKEDSELVKALKR